MNFKTVYQINSLGLYISETVADESPLEPGVFHMPALTVEIAPPTPASTAQAPRWTGTEWELIAIEVPDVEKTSVLTLADEKELAWNIIKAERSNKEKGTFTCDGVVYQTDIIRIGGAAQLAFMAKVSNVAFENKWTSADNTVITLNADQMIAVGKAQGQHVNDVYAIARDLRVLINAATTIGKVKAITWPE